MTSVDERDGVLLLETINPLDLTPDDLAELGAAIRALVDVPVGVAYEDQHGAGVTWHEVIHIWLPTAAFLKDQGWSIVLGIVVENFRSRFKHQGGSRRPKTIFVRDPATGRVLQELVIEEADAPPVSRQSPDSPRKRPPMKRRVT